VSNRHERRRAEAARQSSLARYRRESSGTLWTYLVPADAPIEAALLQRTALLWLDRLPSMVPMRQCIVCECLLLKRADCGGLLLSAPTPSLIEPPVSVSGICRSCFVGDLNVIEEACRRVLATVIAGGQFVDRV
jgi:hypothetical protein